MQVQPQQNHPVRRGREQAFERVSDCGADLYGPVDLATGLGTSSRGFVRALHAVGVPCHVVSTGAICGGHTPVDADLPSDPRRFPVTIEHINADTVGVFLKHFGREVTGAGARVAVWYWELAAFRSDWAPFARDYDEIWVASSFGRRSVAAVTNTPVHVVPPPVMLAEPVQSGGRPRFGIPPNAFVFLYVFDHTSFVDRKNPFCLIRAFLAAFGGDPQALLVLKVSHAGHDAAAFRRLQQAVAGQDNVLLVTEMLDEADLAALFSSADCYVSPHRAEGFGLTVAEAMLRGVPVIATDYGSTTDFVTPHTGYPLECRLVEIADDLGPYPRGCLWADPSQEHLESLLRQVVDVPARARELGEAGRLHMEQQYSLAAAGVRMRDRLLELCRCPRV